MNSMLYKLTEIGFGLITCLCIIIVLVGLKKTLSKTSYTLAKQNKIFMVSTLSLAAWLLFVGILSLKGFFTDFSSFPPRLMLVIFPPFVAILFLTFNKKFTAFLKFVPPSWLIYIQSFRIFVEVLLWLLFIQNLAPIQMSFEGRNFDVLTGLTAPFIAYLCFSQGKMRKALAIIWNIAGLVLLINIVGISILSSPISMRIFMNEPANTIVTYFPIILLPSVLVPLAYSMHFFSLRQLLKS